MLEARAKVWLMRWSDTLAAHKGHIAMARARMLAVPWSLEMLLNPVLSKVVMETCQRMLSTAAAMQNVLTASGAGKLLAAPIKSIK